MRDTRRRAGTSILRAVVLGLFCVVFGGAQSCPPPSPDDADKPGPPLPEARVVVHSDRPASEVSPLVLGAGVEWTENGNGIFDPAAGQVRSDVVDALKPLRIPVVRFPGGILADYYHWRDGIGPREKRPRRKNPMDGTEHENNFGTDEFIELCRAIGAEALITANAGTGSLEEALAWQKHFLEKGFPARYWEIGNEIYLAEPKENASIPGNDQRIYQSPSRYVEQFGRWAPALRAQDADALVGAIAGTYNTSSENRGWLDTLVRSTSTRIDFVALHNSFAPLIFSSYDYNNSARRAEAYRAMFGAAQYTEDDLRLVRRKLDTLKGPRPRLAVTEHFPLFGAGSHDQLLASLDQSRTLAAALYTASLLNAYVRQGVWMANYNLITSKWFGALLTETDGGLVRTPTYHLWDLYRSHLGERSLDVEVSTPSFESRAVGAIAARADVGYLDAIATQDRQGAIHLLVVNRSLHQDLPTVIEIKDVSPGTTADVVTLNGPSAASINGPSLTRTTEGGAGDAIRLERSKWSMSSTAYAFPAHSVTVMTWGVK
jgi:alpha-N-arabinofuranosidase